MRQLLGGYFAVGIEPEPVEREAVALVGIGRPIRSQNLQDGAQILPNRKTVKGTAS